MSSYRGVNKTLKIYLAPTDYKRSPSIRTNALSQFYITKTSPVLSLTLATLLSYVSTFLRKSKGGILLMTHFIKNLDTLISGYRYTHS